MEASPHWSARFSSFFSQFIDRLAQNMPDLFTAIALLLLGWIAARLLRAATVRGMGFLERGLARLLRGGAFERLKLATAAIEVLGIVVFWVVLLFFAAEAAQALGLDAFTALLGRAVSYAPTLFTAALIILAGVVFGTIAKDLVAAAAVSAGERQRMLLGRTAQLVIVTTAVVIGADQAGVKVAFLALMITVAAGALLGGVALALSLGARTYVANLIGSHTVRRMIQVGQTVKIADFAGRVIDITLSTVVLEAADGRVTIPARLFLELPTVIAMGGEQRGEEA